MEARYIDILRQARTIPDVLAVERELRGLREEIESAEGRLTSTTRWVDSTIRLTVYQKLAFAPAPGEGIGSRLLTALPRGLGRPGRPVRGLVYIWPFWVLVGVIVWLLVGTAAAASPAGPRQAAPAGAAAPPRQ